MAYKALLNKLNLWGKPENLQGYFAWPVFRGGFDSDEKSAAVWKSRQPLTSFRRDAFAMKGEILLEGLDWQISSVEAYSLRQSKFSVWLTGHFSFSLTVTPAKW